MENKKNRELKKIVYKKMYKKYYYPNQQLIRSIAKKSHGEEIAEYYYTRKGKRLDPYMKVEFLLGSRYLIRITGQKFWNVPATTILKFISVLTKQFNPHDKDTGEILELRRKVSLENGVFVLQKYKSQFMLKGLYPEEYEKLKFIEEKKRNLDDIFTLGPNSPFVNSTKDTKEEAPVLTIVSSPDTN